MDTRITSQTLFQSALVDTRRLSDQLVALQMQTATGQRFADVSDDPTTVLTLLANTSRGRQIDAHVQNVALARSNLEVGASTLQQVSDLFSQARSIALEGSNSTNDADAFSVLAQQVDALINRLVDYANTQNNDTFLFAGTAVHTAPYLVTARDSLGGVTEVRYQGAGEATQTIVDRHQQMPVYYPGSNLLTAQKREATVFNGSTGAQPGAGTDSATGQADLIFRHDVTSFAPGSGVQVGVSSAAADTIIGPSGSHRLHITDTSGTGSAGTVSLDGGPAVAFTSADADLLVTNDAGDVVHLNLTAISAGFDGDIDVTATGSMSIDGGASFVPITFAADQVARDSESGLDTFVDTTLVRRAGSERVEYAGTSDAFQSLIALRDDLRNAHGLAPSEQIAAISARVADLDRVRNHVLEAIGAQSASLQSLDSLQSHLEDIQLAVQKTQTELGDVDLAEVVVKVQAYQTMLSLSLQTFSRIIDQNLLDFLRT